MDLKIAGAKPGMPYVWQSWKRKCDEDHDTSETPAKRVRISPDGKDRLSNLSDELTLRILSYLSVGDLIRCQRLSKKYRDIACDSQLWKSVYCNDFVRASPLTKAIGWDYTGPSRRVPPKWWRISANSSYGDSKHWKWQYKLRHNWSKGRCTRNEVIVDEDRPLPPLHICLHDGIVYTADQTNGLRAWNTRGDRNLLANFDLACQSPPTALAVDKNCLLEDRHQITVAFRDGSFTIYHFRSRSNTFVEYYTHPASSNGMLLAVAHFSPFLVTITATQILSVYKLGEDNHTESKAPLLVHSLRAQTIWPPFAISLRQVVETYFIGITYVAPTINSWNVGIQEIGIDEEGKIQMSRTASSAYPGSRFRSRHIADRSRISRFDDDALGPPPTPLFSKPSSISYSHPYLLLSHPDNTLSLFMVNSDLEKLEIGDSTRLWGHTSSVSGAHIETRGKAVSVSAKGEEIRLWQLEGSPFRKRCRLAPSRSVEVRPAHIEKDKTIVESKSSKEDDEGILRNWVGFDDENVVVLKERTVGRTNLIVYDFT